MSWFFRPALKKVVRDELYQAERKLLTAREDTERVAHALAEANDAVGWFERRVSRLRMQLEQIETRELDKGLGRPQARVDRVEAL